jgi:PIN domain nuclease of toxin-antitoxin system
VTILVDSHIYVWAKLNDPRLSTRAKSILRSDDHELFFSLASLWELSIKIRSGKLRTLTSSIAFVHDSLAQDGIHILPIRYDDLLAMEQLDNHHKDPFDRILIAQAMANGLKLLTEDASIKRYAGVQTIW